MSNILPSNGFITVPRWCDTKIWAIYYLAMALQSPDGMTLKFEHRYLALV